MESILGFPLFIRNRSKLELTAPGEFLYQEWCGLMPHMESSVVKANLMYEHDLQTLTVGVPDSMEKGSQIEYIEQFQKLYPEVRLLYHVVPANQLLPRLETGELDLIITGIYERRSLERLGAQYKVYMNLPETVIMHCTNPLARRQEITMDDLKDEEFIVLSPTDNASYFERVYLLCAKHGFRPNISLFMPNFGSMVVNLLQTKRGVILTNPLISFAHHPDLHHFEITGTNAGMLTAWKPENTNKYLQKLLELFPDSQEAI